MNNLRDYLWQFATRNHLKDATLTKSLIFIRSLLYPVDTFYWAMSETQNCGCKHDTRTIEGVKYTGAAMRFLANSSGKICRITITQDERVTVDEALDT